MIMDRKYLTRVPQFVNYTNNLDLFERFFENDASLIRDIGMIASFNYGEDLFGYSTLTIENFERLGYSRSELQRRVPEYKHIDLKLEKELIRKRQIELGIIDATSAERMKCQKEVKELPFIHDHLCISRLDYAFYKAFKTAVIASIKEGDRIMAKSFLLFNEIIIDNVSRVDKRKYSFKLSSQWVAHLFQSYNIVDLGDYISLGKDVRIEKANSFKAFYLYLGKMMAVAKQDISKNGIAKFETTVDAICEILGCKITTPSNKKKYVTSFLDDLKAKLTRTLFEWEYYSPTNQRAKYHVLFMFREEVLVLFDEGKKAALMKTILTDAFSSFEVRKRNGEIAILSELKDVDFWDWWVTSNDVELKEQIKAEAYTKVYRRIQLTEKSSKEVKKKIHRIPFTEMDNTARELKKTALKLAEEEGYTFDEKTNDFYKYV